MPLDYSDPLILKFLTENFDKAEEKRMIWFLKNKDKLIKSATFPANYKGLRSVEVSKLSIELCMPTLASHHVSCTGNRRRKALRDGIIQGQSGLITPSRRKGKSENLDSTSSNSVCEPVMKAIDADIQSVLYDTLPNGGRRQYLNKRKRVIPEDKFNFCETNTNVYGWRLKDSGLSRQAPTYGRYFIFEHEINSRSGPQPDPAHYQKPPEEPFSKCGG